MSVYWSKFYVQSDDGKMRAKDQIWHIEGNFELRGQHFYLNSTLFTDVAPCNPVEVHRRFGGTYSLHRKESQVLVSDCTVFHPRGYYSMNNYYYENFKCNKITIWSHSRYDLEVCVSRDFIRELTYWNLCRGSGYPHWDVSVFSSGPQGSYKSNIGHGRLFSRPFLFVLHNYFLVPVSACIFCSW
jgi:hypothetical protein